ncbi:MAG: NADH-quinone oxidoreductase subunit J [Acidobacteriota bacterium]
MSLEALLFITAGLGGVLSALLVVWQRSAVVSALFLVLNLGCVAILFLALGGQFLAAVQVIIYAGAIMVLFLFVIMLLNPSRPGPRLAGGPAAIGLTFALGVLFVAALVRGILALPGSRAPLPATPDDFGSAAAVGRLLFTGYLYPFQLVGVLLVVAMVGAVVLAKREIES